jgi:hypothetical protein
LGLGSVNQGRPAGGELDRSRGDSAAEDLRQGAAGEGFRALGGAVDAGGPDGGGRGGGVAEGGDGFFNVGSVGGFAGPGGERQQQGEDRQCFHTDENAAGGGFLALGDYGRLTRGSGESWMALTLDPA